VARFVVRRSVQACIVLFLVSVFTFLMFQVIPNGNPAERLAGRTATPAEVADIARAWGFNRPLYVQYATMMQKIFSGTVVSYSQQVNVVSQIVRGFGATVSLAVGACIIWLFWGIVLGVAAAAKPNGLADRTLAFAALTAISAPVFVIGAVALYLFSFVWHIFPNGGYVGLLQNPAQWFWHMVLPWCCLALPFIGFYSRVLRSNLMDARNEDFVRMARAKGLRSSRLMRSHILRTSLIPIISLWALDFAGVIGGGAILTESIFDLQGIGQYAAQSIQTLDVPPIMVIVMYTAVLVVIIGALVDILYAYLDPRIQLGA
jgi:peptide/nickel transport system permease protein